MNDLDSGHKRTESDSIRSQVAALNTVREKLEADSEALLSKVMPTITRYIEYIAAYRNEHDAPRNFWRQLGLYQMPYAWQGCDISIELEDSGRRGLQLKVEVRGLDDVEYYDFPWELFGDTDAFLAAQRADWDARYASSIEMRQQQEREARRAEYLKLHAEFGGE